MLLYNSYNVVSHNDHQYYTESHTLVLGMYPRIICVITVIYTLVQIMGQGYYSHNHITGMSVGFKVISIMDRTINTHWGWVSNENHSPPLSFIITFYECYRGMSQYETCTRLPCPP